MHDDAAERLAAPGQFRYCSAEELHSWLDPRPDWTVADLGSGPGLYTDTIAQSVGRVLAIDRSAAMHAAHRERDPPATVHSVRADHGTLPVADGSLDAAVSLRTFHHGVRDALPGIVAALRPGGRLVVLDWSTSAPDFEAGPPEHERYDVAGIARAMIDAGCRIVRTEQRRETDLVIGERRV
ncbi:class I SAM-dependent methyltransferase [Halococcoides cellulosivorans]|uniref:SAM-dependent methyltransferase n=1 Tax=Halococcoides cellulosivorans TaxID=1679096 RepID=A0A2R4X0D1_9EURY|nr:methyltransferase domain-containing protein [Halococcoides cellulosivorans]AWB27221.1 SAM-dependent methyltransferase [Halococcoides cellulosivorans]